jgi:hypothetical protein
LPTPPAPSQVVAYDQLPNSDAVEFLKKPVLTDSQRDTYHSGVECAIFLIGRSRGKSALSQSDPIGDTLTGSTAVEKIAYFTLEWWVYLSG